MNMIHDESGNNFISYKWLTFLSMIYMSIMLCNAILTNRYIGTDSFFVLGGTLTSPFLFILDDIITEIYGYKITQNIIFSGFIAQTIFVLICLCAVSAPYPTIFQDNLQYKELLGLSLLRIDASGCIAYISANLINSYILSRWKILVKGKYFWLRSIGSSTISEALYTLLAIFMMELFSIPFNQILQVATISFLIKLSYSIIFSLPSSYFVSYLKNVTGMDIYDFPKNFTPFKYQRRSI